MLSDVFQEDQYREDDPFIGCMGLISRENIRKPAYNAYHFLAQMGGEQIDPTLAYDVTAYRVDESHGNAYATWAAQGRPSMSAMTEEHWQALRDTMNSPPEPLGEALCGETFAASFELSSPGVLFVTLPLQCADGPPTRASGVSGSTRIIQRIRNCGAARREFGGGGR